LRWNSVRIAPDGMDNPQTPKEKYCYVNYAYTKGI